jgi:hypothetical protein
LLMSCVTMPFAVAKWNVVPSRRTSTASSSSRRMQNFAAAIRDSALHRLGRPLLKAYLVLAIVGAVFVAVGVGSVFG